MKHSKRGYCEYCTLHNQAKRSLGLRHPMLPVQAWHGLTYWKWTSGFARFNDQAILRLGRI